MNVKILKKIIIAFLFSLSHSIFSRLFFHPQESKSFFFSDRRQKKSFSDILIGLLSWDCR